MNHLQKAIEILIFALNLNNFFFKHFPKNSEWQLMTPNLSMKEFINRLIPRGNLYELFTKTDSVYYTIQVKKNVIRFYKKVEKVLPM